MPVLVYLSYFPAILKLVARLLWGRSYQKLARQVIPGSYDYTGNFNRKVSLDQKYEAIRGEFQGSNELCFEIARRIVQIRRGIQPERNWLYIFGAVLNQPDKIFPNITLRWTVSILDTFSDMACPARCKLAAGSIVGFVLGLRLGYSMAVQSVPDPNVQPEPAHAFAKQEIWDGIIHFDYRVGDTYRNYIQRTANQMKPIPHMAVAWRAVLVGVARLPAFKFALTNNEKSRTVFNQITKSAKTK